MITKEVNAKQNKVSFADAVKNKSVLPEMKNKKLEKKTKKDLNKKIDSIKFKITNIINTTI